jgi:hypothetical protein
MRGNIPAILIWCGALTTLGFIVGVPVAHFLSALERLAISGGIFVILGIGSYRAVRKSPRNEYVGSPMHGVISPVRYILAIILDAAVVTTIASGFDRIARAFIHLPPPEGGPDSAILIAAIAFSYIVATRRGGSGETAGERLLNVSYVYGHGHPMHP